MLDTAAYAPSHPINLTEIGADFVDFSMYKLFGYPTGVGALILRKDAASLLKKVRVAELQAVRPLCQAADSRCGRGSVCVWKCGVGAGSGRGRGQGGVAADTSLGRPPTSTQCK